MSYTLAPITLTENVTSYVTLPGSGQSVSYIKLTNASPYIVLLSNLTSGQDYLQPGECNVWQVDGLSTAIQATPQAFLSAPNTIPVAKLVATWYLAGEPAPAGSYPVNFNLLQYLGNSVMVNSATDTIEQDLLTPFVLSGLAPSKDGSVANQLDTTAGVAYPKQSDGSLLRQSLIANAFLTTAHSATYYLDLNPDASWSWGTSHSTQTNYLTIAQATTDGSGNIATVTDERVTNTYLLSGLNGTLYLPTTTSIPASLVFTEAGYAGAGTINLGSGNTLALSIAAATNSNISFNVTDGASSYVPFAVGDPLTFIPSAYIDNSGTLHTTHTPRITTGNQETGACGGGFTATAGAQLFMVYVNFKTVMTNVPSSITLSGTATNATSVTADVITIYGFRFHFVSSAAGTSEWNGTYTTVGN